MFVIFTLSITIQCASHLYTPTNTYIYIYIYYYIYIDKSIIYYFTLMHTTYLLKLLILEEEQNIPQIGTLIYHIY